MRCFAKLAPADTCDCRKSTLDNLAEGQTVEDLCQREGIAKEDVKLVFVNSKKADLTNILSDVDRVGLATAIGGM